MTPPLPTDWSLISIVYAGTLTFDTVSQLKLNFAEKRGKPELGSI